jgi:chloramphenicol 3-O-phosphotransferase
MTEESGKIPVLVITGPVGVGKTSVAASVSEILDERGIPHACIDLDWLRWCHPAPGHDPFNVTLGLKNLSAVWANCRAAGAERLIIADVVEAPEEREGYLAAVPGAYLWIVRLTAPVSTLHERLEGRETGASLEWHKARAVELAGQMEETALEDLKVDTDGRTVRQVAEEVLTRSRGFGDADSDPR